MVTGIADLYNLIRIRTQYLKIYGNSYGFGFMLKNIFSTVPDRNKNDT